MTIVSTPTQERVFSDGYTITYLRVLGSHFVPSFSQLTGKASRQFVPKEKSRGIENAVK